MDPMPSLVPHRYSYVSKQKLPYQTYPCRWQIRHISNLLPFKMQLSDSSEALGSNWSKGGLGTWDISDSMSSKSLLTLLLSGALKPLVPWSLIFWGSWWDFQKCEIFTREDCSDMSINQQKVFISQPMTTLCVWDPRVALNLSQGELLRKINYKTTRTTKTMSFVLWWHTSVNKNNSQMQNSRLQKERLVDLVTFLEW